MNKDIRISVSFKNHRKRKRLTMLLGEEATGHLLDLWIGVAVSRPNGVLIGWDKVDIALEANFTGDPDLFASALCDSGFLDCEDEVFSMHDWQEHNPYASGAEERSNKARFSKLKQAYPALHKKLVEEGVKSISAGEYQRTVSEWLANRKGKVGDSLAPSPSPSPSPSPNNTVGEKPPTEINKNEIYIPIAELLRSVVLLRRHQNIPPVKVQKWANTIRLMVEIDEVNVEDIAAGINWYRHHWNDDDFVPVIESARSLREKWGKLLVAAKRAKDAGSVKTDNSADQYKDDAAKRLLGEEGHGTAITQ